MARIRVAAAQLNLVVGDLEGNVAQLLEALGRADEQACDLVAFPELAITAYPPEDLLLKPRFIDDNLRALDRVVEATGRCAAVVGFVDRVGGELFNAAAVCADGRLLGVYHKRRLPNYAVFDEQRYFTPGTGTLPLYRVAGIDLGVSVCEDAWAAGGPVADQAAAGAALVVNVNASPYHAGKVHQREEMLAARAAEAGCALLYVNLVGGQDELVFDGASVIVDANGAVLARAPQYQAGVFVAELDCPAGSVAPAGPERIPVSDTSRAPAALAADPPAALLGREAEIYGALVTGTRDYVVKNGFSDVVIGLSGGVDSSLVAAVAVDALGPERVHGVLMPSRYSSDHSLSDAERLCSHLGIEHRTIAIEPAFQALCSMLEPSGRAAVTGLAEENLQPRIRGTLLMALSNAFGWLVLTTGNKSEMAVGYATLYGDMAGGFAVIKDVPKTWVYDLCRFRNAEAGHDLIPAHVIDKPPSAELRPDQLDTDSLPPYHDLDPILAAYVEQDRTASELVAAGFDEELVRRVTRLVDLAEYKRRQAPPGVRVTTKAFGKDRRLPLTNGYRGWTPTAVGEPGR